MLTPGHYLAQFALSVDTIDAEAYDEVLNLLGDYLKEALTSSYYAIRIDGVRIEGAAGPQPGLKTVWSSREGDEMIPVFKGDGQYTGQLAYAYHLGKPLWITSPGESRLADAGEHQDSWSHVSDLPPYRTPSDTADERTSIIVPLRYGGRVFGVMDIEFVKRYEFSMAARDELVLLTDAIARIIRLRETNENSTKSTRRALESLEEQFEAAHSPLERPTIFVASPSEADDAAMEATLEVVRSYEDRFDIEFWQDMAASGNINQQVADAITSCHVGICFLSARNDGDAPGNGDGSGFTDNANVLFEAGMLYALKHQPQARPANWIVIRESKEIAGPPPFDLASERMVIVSRDDQNGLLRDEFQSALRATIDSSLEEI